MEETLEDANKARGKRRNDGQSQKRPGGTQGSGEVRFKESGLSVGLAIPRFWVSGWRGIEKGRGVQGPWREKALKEKYREERELPGSGRQCLHLLSKKGLMAQGMGCDQGQRDNGSAEARGCGWGLPSASAVV